MNFPNQYLFIKNLERLLGKGYSLKEALNMLKHLKYKEIEYIDKKLQEGMLLSLILKKLKFKTYIYEGIRIGEKTNKLNEAIILVAKQMEFYQKVNKQISKVLLYPLVLLCFAIICFEVIRINLYPVVKILLNDYQFQNNELFAFLTFNSLKIMGLLVLIIVIIINVYKPLGNLIPLIKEYRVINLLKYLEILLVCGYSLDEAFRLLTQSLNNKIYQLEILSFALLGDKELPKLTPYNRNIIEYLQMGIKSNDLVRVINDYHYFYDSLLFDKFAKITYYLQFIFFLLLSVNIFCIYYLIMFPMFQITNNI